MFGKLLSNGCGCFGTTTLFTVTVPAALVKAVSSESKENFTSACSLVFPGGKDCSPDTALIFEYAGCLISDKGDKLIS